MAESDAMLEHINRMTLIVGQLESVRATVTEEDQVAALLCSLPDSYNNLSIALQSKAEDLKADFHSLKRERVGRDLAMSRVYASRYYHFHLLAG